MSHALSTTDMARNFADYINRVTYRGESFTIVRGKKSVAELSPVLRGRPLSELAGILAALPRLSNEELDGFEEDLAEIRSAANHSPSRDPWES